MCQRLVYIAISLILAAAYRIASSCFWAAQASSAIVRAGICTATRLHKAICAGIACAPAAVAHGCLRAAASTAAAPHKSKLHNAHCAPLLFVFLLSHFAALQAQSVPLVVTTNPIVISATAIDSSTLRITYNNQTLVPNIHYTILSNNTQVQFKDTFINKTVYLQFAAINPMVLEPYQKNQLFTNQDYTNNPNVNNNIPSAAGNSSDNNVKTLGILSRGISFGNSQDLVLNSNLNLRLTGKLANNFTVEGAITDQEFPFQPEGTTSSLQDFDRIYMKFYSDKHAITLGDHLFQNPTEFSFLKFNKKNRGMLYQFQSSSTNPTHQVQVEAALARGRFSRNDLQGQEGLQGPYKLSGARNELFIIIISGTEQVYLDGVKMQRGLQDDYTIDYNLGEITFTPKHLINAYSRIVVEFQYSDRFYTRTISGANYVYTHKKLKTFAAIYSENDIKSQPIQQDLDLFDSSKNLSATQLLQTAGDNLLNASITGVKTLGQFNPNVPNYIRIDTGAFPYYVYVSQAGSFTQFYSITFSYVGPGKGNYVLDGTVANGKVYKYTAPIGGVPSGFYEPLVQIIAPNATQMAETGFSYQLSPKTSIYTSISGSRQDLNTFSKFNDSDNLGYAFKTAINTQLTGKDSLHRWQWKHSFYTDYSSQNFKSIERFRDVEATRNWNKTINNENYQTTQTKLFSINYSSAFELPNKLEWQAKASQFYISNALVNDLSTQLTYKLKNLYYTPAAAYNNSQNKFNKYKRLTQNLGYKTSTQHHYLQYWQEKSEFNTVFGLNDNSYKFNQALFASQFALGSYKIAAQATQRLMFNSPQYLSLTRSNLAQNYTLSIQQSAHRSALIFSLNYRKSKLLDTLFKNLYATENHISSRIEYNAYSLKSPFKFNTYYQTISGREQQRQYAYFEVPAGQGQYAWQDYNLNGIREINEFVESPFPDQAKFVRLLIPTAQYINSQGSELYGNLQYRRPEKESNTLWRVNTSYNLNAKTISPQIADKLLPFMQKLSNVNTLQAQYYLRNQTEFENKKRNLYLLQNTQYRATKLLLTNGFDTKQARLAQLAQRYSPNAQWQLFLQQQIALNNYNSQINALYNYSYTAPAMQAGITWQPSQKLKISAQTQNTWYQNSAIQLAKQTQAQLSIAKSIGKGGLANMEFTYIRNQYNGADNTPLSFDILQGFTAGNNLRGMANIRFNPNKNIQVISGYELRRSQTSKTIHIGRTEIRYLF